MLMKKITALLIALTAMVCMSCDEDTEIAYRLEGEWDGDMGMYYVYESADRYGPYSMEYDAQYTNIRFVRTTLTSGYGDQVDFYNRGPYEWRSFSFRWSVRNGNIYMDYDYADELDCVIYDYYIDRNHLGGMIGNTRIVLDKLRDFTWDGYIDYNDGYDYNYYYDYAKTRSAGAAADSVKAGRVVKGGSRCSE